MDHSHHEHPTASGARCQMSMLFTWNTENLCLVFRWWHVTSTFSLLLSLLAVVFLGMGYEYVRSLSHHFDSASSDTPESRSLLGAPDTGLTTTTTTTRRSTRRHVARALFYGLQVFYSFFMMLLFMTYNGWVMIAVSVGAAAGHFVWGGGSAAKSVACH